MEVHSGELDEQGKHGLRFLLGSLYASAFKGPYQLQLHFAPSISRQCHQRWRQQQIKEQSIPSRNSSWQLQQASSSRSRSKQHQQPQQQRQQPEVTLHPRFISHEQTQKKARRLFASLSAKA